MPINGEEVDEHLRNLLAKKGINLAPSALEKMKVAVFLHTLLQNTATDLLLFG